jgi:hypothetical protein
LAPKPLLHSGGAGYYYVTLSSGKVCILAILLVGKSLAFLGTRVSVVLVLANNVYIMGYVIILVLLLDSDATVAFIFGIYIYIMLLFFMYSGATVTLILGTNVCIYILLVYLIYSSATVALFFGPNGIYILVDCDSSALASFTFFLTSASAYPFI